MKKQLSLRPQIALALLAGVGLTGSAHAQNKTYATTIVNPYLSQVDQFTVTTTTSSQTYGRASFYTGSTQPQGPTGGLSGQTAVAYGTGSYTPTQSGEYVISNTTSGYGTGADTGSSNFLQFLYSPTFTPGQPGATASLSLQNEVLSDNPTYTAGSTTDSYAIDADPTTPLTLVNTGRYNATAANDASSSMKSTGTSTTTISFLNPGSTTPIADPGSIPAQQDTNPATQTLNISDTGTVTAFNGITINGLNDTFMGDLTATLTHNGVTVDLFDHIGGTSLDYNNDPGSGFVLSSSNTYTFAQTGSNFSAFGYHPQTGSTPGYWDTIPTGTYAAAGNTAGGADAADAANTLSKFAGGSVGGAWTLNIYNNDAGNSGSFLGFSLNMNVAPAPEPSEYAGLGLGLLGLVGLGLRARRKKIAA